jgi:hypothetical protein
VTQARYAIDPTGMLTVRGTTTTLVPYEVEITDRARAQSWRRALDGRQYHRLCVGNKPITLGDLEDGPV